MTRAAVLSKADAKRLAETATEQNVVVTVRRGDLVIEFRPADNTTAVPVTLDAWRERKGK